MSTDKITLRVLDNVGPALRSKKQVERIIQSIPEENFASIRDLFIEVLDSQERAIAHEVKLREEYQSKVEVHANLILDELSENKVSVTDVLSEMCTRGCVYVFPNADGSTGKWLGKGQKPPALVELLNNGNSLDDYRVDLSDFVSS